jgi:hypothetical protein
VNKNIRKDFLIRNTSADLLIKSILMAIIPEYVMEKNHRKINHFMTHKKVIHSGEIGKNMLSAGLMMFNNHVVTDIKLYPLFHSVKEYIRIEIIVNFPWCIY